MFSLQVTMFIICSHISFLVNRERFIMSCLFVCSLLGVALSSFFSTAFYLHTRNRSLKDKNKCVRARRKITNLTSVVFVSLNFFSIWRHSLSHCTFTAFASHCCRAALSIRGVKFLLCGLWCFWPVATASLPDVSPEFSDCTQTLLAPFHPNISSPLAMFTLTSLTQPPSF